MLLASSPDVADLFVQLNENDPDLYSSIDEMSEKNAGVQFPHASRKARKLIERIKSKKSK